jgi:hypothetical protein
MTRRQPRLMAWLAILVVAMTVGCKPKPPPEPTALLDAVQSHQVDVSVSAPSSGQVTITVTRSGSGAGGDAGDNGADAPTFVLAAGTVISGGDSGVQRLMTAQDATFVFGASTTASATVPTYCIDPFKETPGVSTVLAIDPAQQDAEDVGPARKLAQCLRSDQSGAANDQLAIWATTDGFLDKTYDEARSAANDGYRQGLEAQMAKRMQSFADRLRQAAPTASQADIDREVARFTPAVVSARLDQEAHDMTDRLLAGFLGGGRPLLDKCGYDTASSQFYRTAPSSSP